MPNKDLDDLLEKLSYSRINATDTITVAEAKRKIRSLVLKALPGKAKIPDNGGNEQILFAKEIARNKTIDESEAKIRKVLG